MNNRWNVTYKVDKNNSNKVCFALGAFDKEYTTFCFTSQ